MNAFSWDIMRAESSLQRCVEFIVSHIRKSHTVLYTAACSIESLNKYLQIDRNGSTDIVYESIYASTVHLNYIVPTRPVKQSN